MTTLLVCVLAGLVPLLWPARLRSGSRPVVGAFGDVPESAPRRPRVRWPRRTRSAVTAEDVADALVLVSLGLRAGLPLTAALDHVRAGAAGPVHDDLAAVVAALRWGLPTREAWDYAGALWRPAAAATQLSEHTGAAAAGLLEAAASRMREEAALARERAAARAGVLLVLPLGLGFLPSFACTAVVPVVVTLASGVLSSSS